MDASSAAAMLASLQASLDSGPAQERLRIPLWPGAEHPQLQVFDAACPPMHRRAAVIVFRGGSYRINNGSGEGCAAYFAERGVVGIEAEYRTVEGPGACAIDKDSGPLFPRPLQDAARAIRLVRQKASELNIDPNRIGVVGFSAGGHLAAIMSTGELPCQEATEEDLVLCLSSCVARPSCCQHLI
eukprot:TRINITY_DN38158_c0_g3_i2.p1 TRINITY_DN38158_c0_g3~~TRINITY_DN38158_c0_g3_i2.p1  ORF type:complete len:185 (-),score=16.75 TRINITY_DN38158_c0_g3_i2:1229-1783(-)